MKYFVTKGNGESNLKCLKNETTSYDDAVVNAGLGNINAVNVSSMIPPDCKETKKVNYKWGDIVHCIMARNDSVYGKFISCALLVVEVKYNKKALGSFVLEYSSKGTEKVALNTLFEQLGEMIKRRNYGNVKGKFKLKCPSKTSKEGYTITPNLFLYNSMKIKKKFGTVICVISFVK